MDELTLLVQQVDQTTVEAQLPDGQHWRIPKTAIAGTSSPGTTLLAGFSIKGALPVEASIARHMLEILLNTK